MTTASTLRLSLAPDARREQILQCAIGVYSERSYSDVSTSDLAREAGVTRSLINHYYGDKRGLYLVVVRQMVMMPRGSLDAVPPHVGSPTRSSGRLRRGAGCRRARRRGRSASRTGQPPCCSGTHWERV